MMFDRRLQIGYLMKLGLHGIVQVSSSYRRLSCGHFMGLVIVVVSRGSFMEVYVCSQVTA